MSEESKQSSWPNVRGQCPMGCGETLFLGADDYVTCSYVGCGNPSAAADLLRHAPLHKAIKDAMQRVVENMNGVMASNQDSESA